MTQPPPNLRRRLYISRAPQRQTLRAQGEEQVQRVIVDLTGAAVTRIVANVACRSPYPNYALCRTLDDLANQQANKASDSLVTFAVFAVLAAIIGGK